MAEGVLVEVGQHLFDEDRRRPNRRLGPDFAAGDVDEREANLRLSIDGGDADRGERRPVRRPPEANDRAIEQRARPSFLTSARYA